jgi:hypothetical protein
VTVPVFLMELSCGQDEKQKEEEAEGERAEAQKGE